jgi:hypothetical protein
MSHSRHNLTSMLLLVAIGCGPPRAGLGPGDDAESETTGSDTTSNPDTTTSPGTSDTQTSDPETSDPETSDTGVEFVPKHDGATDDGGCDPFAQDCPEGEKCVFYASSGGSWDANKCVPVMGDQMPGEPCWYGGALEATDNCDETGACWNAIDVEGELVGICQAFCTGSPDNPECPPKSSCAISGNGSPSLCIDGCDPLVQDCGPGLACYWANGNFNCIFTTEGIPAGEPCGFINDCAGGNICVAAESLPACAGSACCTPFCDLELGEGPCGAVPGTSCVPLFEEGAAPPGYDLVGVCMSP